MPKFEVVDMPSRREILDALEKPAGQRPAMRFQLQSAHRNDHSARGVISAYTHREDVSLHAYWLELTDTVGNGIYNGLVSLATCGGWLGRDLPIPTDELGLIGLDKDLEKSLRAAGITSYRQLAEWSDFDLCRVLIKRRDYERLPQAATEQSLKRLNRIRYRLKVLELALPRSAFRTEVQFRSELTASWNTLFPTSS